MWSKFLLRKCGDMADRRILYLFGLISAAAFYLIYQEWFSWIVLLTVVLLPWISLFMSLWAMFGTKTELMLPEQVEKGSIVKAEIDVTCRTVARPPFKGRIKVTKPSTGEKWFLAPGEKLPTSHSGGLVAELHRAKLCDYLGLFAKKVRHVEPLWLVVMPTPVKLAVPPDLTRFIARAWRPKPGGGYAENHELRSYRPGDRLNLVHWKLSAKADELMVREPMVPDQSRILLTIDLTGTPDELDQKLGQLLWLGTWLSEQGVPYEVTALTGNGIENRTVSHEWDLQMCMEDLLFTPPARDGSIRDRSFAAAWRYHIGGGEDEAE